jgi:ABC-type transporter Mla MlaB component
MSVTAGSLSDLSTVSIEGEFTLPRITEIRDTLLRAIDREAKVHLNLANISQVDISALQLFCSIHKTLDMRSKTVTITGKAPALFSELLARAGYYKHAACPATLKGPCLLEEATCE